LPTQYHLLSGLIPSRNQPTQPMKKVLIGLALFLAISVFMYGAITALLGQGLSLPTALTVFFLVILGGAGLIWMLRDKPGSSPPN
jgi:uncharacterized membrane protein